jgi:hypothetical protein
MERELRRLPDCSETDGRDILHKLLRVPRRVATMLEDLARQLLRLPGTGEVPSEGDQGVFKFPGCRRNLTGCRNIFGKIQRTHQLEIDWF